MALPTQTVTAMQQQVALDARACLADWVVQCFYQPVGADAAVEVDAVLTDKPVMIASPGGLGAKPAGQHSRRVRFVQVAGLLPDETFSSGDALGSAGGVVKLSQDDVFTVPGRVIGRADDEVTLRVARIVEFHEGLWTAEVSGG